MSSAFSTTTSPFTLLLLFAVLIGSCFPFNTTAAVRSESNSTTVIRLPSDRISGDICAGKVTRTSCPVNCFRTDPVCGIDGVTYWCGCADAQCAGTSVAKLGFCEVGNGGSDTVSGQALLLVHIVWLILLGFSVLFGLL
ncbi:uncharacterized protein LOC132315020 [Cornus florida]|uniref:uncharacterized protein LOC132315020 n=1 Tax=Cornus florida TaxID=4283 RepID=UPI00289D80E2|nr:uncharacterized protein LOC132315020 [Cornus florida]